MATNELNISLALLKSVPQQARNLFGFYKGLIYPKKAELLDKTINTISDRFDLNESDFRIFLQNYHMKNRKRLSMEEKLIMNEFFKEFYKNLYEDDNTRPELIAHKIVDIENSLDAINKKISIKGQSYDNISHKIKNLDKMKNANIIALLEDLIKFNNVKMIKLFFNFFDSDVGRSKIENDNFANLFFAKLIKIISNYERIDISIIYYMLTFFINNWYIFQLRIKNMSDRKIVQSISLLLEASLYELNSLSALYPNAILIGLIESLLKLFISISNHECYVGRNISNYFIKSIKLVLENIDNKISIYNYVNLDLYKKSDFRYSLDLFVRILFLIPSAKIFLSQFINLNLELKSIIIKINNRLRYRCKIYRKYLTEDFNDITYIAWDVLSRILPINNLVNNIYK